MLVPAVSAQTGTKAGKVLRAIDNLVREKSLPITIFENRLKDLHLREVPGQSFSLKYWKEGDVLILPIGHDLPDAPRKILHVAQSIVAMIMRGDNWQDKGTSPDCSHSHTRAYGADSRPKPKKSGVPHRSKYRTHSMSI